MNQGKRSLPGIAFLDFLANLLMLFLVMFALAFVMVRPKSSTPSIETLGYYAVVVTWTTGSHNDVDTYVQDPQDNISYFVQPQAGLMHLEQDDLGSGISNSTTVNGKLVSVKQNQERVIIQGIIPGEYTVNVQMYQKRDSGPQKVTIKLYRLRGQDEVLLTQTVVLAHQGDEKTAFRFTLNAAGQMCCANHLFKDIVYKAQHTYVPSSGENGFPGGPGNGTQPPTRR